MKVIQGSFAYPDGTPAAGAVVNFKLLQDAVASGSVQVSPQVRTVTLDANGSLPAGYTLWANDELLPTGTYYTVSVIAPGGGLIWGPEQIQISGTSPINLNTVSPTAGAGVTNAAAVLQNPTAAQTITGFDLKLATANLIVDSAKSIQWGSSGVGGVDTNISRISAGVLGVGTGSQGSIAGSLKAANANFGSSTTSFDVGFTTSGKLGGGSATVIGWSATNPTAALDTGLSRDSAGAVNVGNGTLLDKSGTIKAAAAVIASTGAGSGGSAAPIQVIATTAPGLSFEASGGGADQKWWDILPHSTDWNIRAVNDANNSAATALTINRGAGATIGAITFGAGGGTQTLPTATDTLVGRATTDTLQNKALVGASSGNSVTLLNSQDTLGNVTGNGTDQTLYTFTIPANTVQAGKGIRLTCTTINNTPASTVYKITLGATTLTYGAAVNGTQRFVIEIFNNAAVQNSQVWNSFAFDGTVVLNNGNITSAENFANTLTLKITANVANPNTTTPKKWILELIQ